MDLGERIDDLMDLLWTAKPGMALPFGLKDIDEVARELRKAWIAADTPLRERCLARQKELAKPRYEARQKELAKLRNELWQGTGGPPESSRGWIRRVWPNEAKDFTPWLAAHLERVSLCTGSVLDLRFEGREVDIALAGRADIIARDNKSKSKVVIENQLDAADSAHMQQLSAYGDGLNARVRIWIAADFSPKYRREARARNRLSKSRPGGPIYYLLKLEPHPTMPLSVIVSPRNPYPLGTTDAALRGRHSGLLGSDDDNA